MPWYYLPRNPFPDSFASLSITPARRRSSSTSRILGPLRDLRVGQLGSSYKHQGTLLLRLHNQQTLLVCDEYSLTVILQKVCVCVCIQRHCWKHANTSMWTACSSTSIGLSVIFCHCKFVTFESILIWEKLCCILFNLKPLSLLTCTLWRLWRGTKNKKRTCNWMSQKKTLRLHIHILKI